MPPPFPPVFDGHNDTITDLHRRAAKGPERSFFAESDLGHIDLPRARRGGFGGGFFAVFVPSPEMAAMDPDAPPPDPLPPMPAIDPAYARTFTEELVDALVELESRSEGSVAVVRDVEHLDRCLREGVLAAILHFEGAETIHPDLDALEHFYARGLRSLGLVWSRPNAYGHGVPFDFPGSPDIGPGLTDRGRSLVRECNRLGVLVDLSHLNERGFWDVADVSDAPLVATHASAHALSPSPRNLTDAQLDEVARTGGVVGINFHVGFIRADGTRDPDTPLDVLVRHVTYVVDRIGDDHVALGSDFDGATMPDELGDVAGLPRLLEKLVTAGFDHEALVRITHGNWLRVLGETWK